MKALFIYVDNQSRSSDPVELERFIHSLGTPLAYEGHFWIIETSMTVTEVRDAIQPLLTDFDLLLVGTVGTEFAIRCWASHSISDLRSRFTVDG